ncbi:MAG: YibE/F family protein [Kiritimatiellae bacterium]|nr:YibE/F family protein [Kiritimatiellia bacterium]
MSRPPRRGPRLRARDWIPPAVLAALCAAMALAPSAATVARDDGSSMRARVVSADDSHVSMAGLVEYGTQHLEVEMLEGPARGRRFRAENELRAQLDIDKKFAPGDTASVAWPDGGAGEGDTLVARDHWRLGWAFALFAAFAALLVAFGGAVGAKALFSFAFSCFAVWKLLVPLCLGGWNAGWTSFAVVAVLSAVILYLVAGATRTFAAALLGSVLGVAASLALAHVFARGMHVTGATMPFVQALLYSGYQSLDMADLYCGAVILASSGAVMDLSMDIAAGLAEVARHRPDLSRRALLLSGLRIGRAVVGTMTTTLLFAYSGGYLTLLMVFAAQGTRPADFLNSTIVSAELVKTLVGSFGLLLVAPMTAFAGAALFARRPPKYGIIRA